MNFITFEQLNACIYQNITKIPKDIDLVVGIPRSGMLVANLIALDLNLPFTDMESFLDGRMYKTGSTRKCKSWITSVQQAKKVLIVDDSISKGNAMKEAKEKLKDVYPDKQYVFCAAYALPTNISQVDVYFEICNHPRMFEWNYLHHWGLQYACMDLEGIIEEKGIPKILPTQKVKYIISVKKEEERQQIETWLCSNGIEFERVILRTENMEFSPVQWKAEFYKKHSDSVIYISAKYEEAEFICKEAGKQVFCQETRELLTPESLIARAKIKAKDTKITAKRVYRKLTKKI